MKKGKTPQTSGCDNSTPYIPCFSDKDIGIIWNACFTQIDKPTPAISHLLGQSIFGDNFSDSLQMAGKHTRESFKQRLNLHAVFYLGATQQIEESSAASSRIRKWTPIENDLIRIQKFLVAPVNSAASVQHRHQEGVHRALDRTISFINNLLNSGITEDAALLSLYTPDDSEKASLEGIIAELTMLRDKPNIDNFPAANTAVNLLLKSIWRVKKKLEDRKAYKGGNRPNEALYTFLLNLADLYKEVTGKSGTASIDPSTGKACGTLLDFFGECLCSLHPRDTPLKDDALLKTYGRAKKLANNTK